MFRTGARLRPRRFALSLGLTLVVVLSCAGSAPVPSSQQGALAPALRDPAAQAVEGPFRVVFAAPRGEAGPAPEISIVFSRSVRALDRADVPPPAIAIQPPVAGQWRWVGSRALAFAPASGQLPAATEFAVEVPGSVRAVDGVELGSPHRFTFTTLRPRVVQSAPETGATAVLPTATIQLELNQRVAPAAIERFGTLTAGGKRLPFSARPFGPSDRKTLQVEPKTPLPRGTEIRFELAAELVGQEGPLTAGEPTTIRFETYGPLRIDSVECNRESPRGRCQPGAPVALTFNNPVRFGDVQRSVQIAPALPLRWPSWQEPDSTTTYVELPAEFAAGHSYRIRLGAGLRDIYGQTLAREFQRDVAIDDYFPRVAIGVTDGTLLPAERGPIPLAAVNADGARVRAAALTRDEALRIATEQQKLADLLRTRTQAHEMRLTPGAAKNRLVIDTLDPSAVLGTSGLGVLGIGSVYEPDERDYSAPPREKLAKVSDLALSAKLSRHGSLVWVSRLSSAAPVPNAEIELVSGAKRRKYRSSADGFAEIPAADFAPNLDWDSPDRKAVLFAAAGNEWTYERVADLLDAWSLPVPTDLSGELQDVGMLFTDRGVYRPGDTVRVKGVVRRQTARGSSVPRDETVRLTLRSPDDEELRKHELRVSSWGTFTAAIQLPVAAGLGSYRLSASLGRNSIDEHVLVEEYRPAEFTVRVSATPQAVRGGSAEFDVNAEYLFGAPLAAGSVRYSITRSPTSFTPPGADAFVTDASAYYADREEASLAGGALAETEERLDSAGRLRRAQPLALPGQRSPELVSLEAEVTDTARQANSARASVLVHPALFYLGIEPPKEYLAQAPSTLRPSIAAVSPDGKRHPGARVKLELIERRWTAAHSAAGGTFARVDSKLVDRVVAACELVTTATAASCPLPLKTFGYHVIRARSVDAAGNAVEAANGLYAVGPGEASWRNEDSNNVQLVLDRKTYRVGETARVLVQSPFPEAEALITVERAGILRRERRSFRGSMPSFDIPVTDAERPNAFVAVHLVRKAGKGSAQGAYRVGYAELKIDPEQQRLLVDVKPSSSDLAPGQTVEVDLLVRYRGGQAERAEVTVYAVDEGVLLLTGYRTPDPVPVFTATRPLGVATLETRRSMARILRPEPRGLLFDSKGAEGGGGGDSVRQDFQQTAYFNPNVLTDAQGKARVRFRVPDSLTRYRVMAVAVTEGEKFGYADAALTVSKRLMARPALPRFLRAGDRVQAGVVVNAKGFGPSDVEVQARVDGLILEGAPVARFRLEKDGSREVRFALRADRVGTAKLRVDVRAGTERDSVAVERRVLSPASLEATALSGATTSAVSERLGALAGVRADVGGLEVSVASTALVGIDSALEDLGDYPYGCSEQIASRLLAGVLRARFAARPGAPAAPLPGTAGTELRQLIARQRGDGGFGFWADANESHAWISAYALWVLEAARKAGVEVPAQSLLRGREYLRQYLAKGVDEPVHRATATFAVDVLASLGEPDLGYMSRLFEQRGKLPLFGRALLLSAYAKAAPEAAPVSTLVTDLEGAIRSSGPEATIAENLGDDYEVLMDSTTRTHAMVLRALAEANPRHPLLAELARGLLRQRRAGSWPVTQDAAFALVALDQYTRSVERDAPAFDASVRFGARELLQARYEGRSYAAKRASIPAAALFQARGDALVFERSGDGTLFYEARLRYARAELPRTALDAGFYIEKRLRAVKPEELARALETSAAVSAHGFGAGDLVLAEVTVVNPAPREYVVIDDPMPAGFEAVNSRLLTTSSRYDLPNGGDGGDRRDIAEGRRVRSSAHRLELFDDRAVFLLEHMEPGLHRYRYLARASSVGRFVVPASRVEGMYAPEVFGRTAAGVVEVR